MEPRADDDGTLADLPWASVFDPAANVRALGEIQARGLRAAGEVVDKMVRAIDGAGATDATARAEAATDGDDRRDADNLMASWSALLAQLIESLGGALGARDGGAARLDFGDGGASGELALDADGAGPARTEVWVHNPTTADKGCIRLRCSDLLAHDGGVVPGSALRLDPAELPMPARSSRGVDVTVDAPIDLRATDDAPAVYRGSLLVEGHPELWLPVVLTVFPPAT